MAWKKYKDMSPEEKKKGWDRLKTSAYNKALQNNRKSNGDNHPEGHTYDPNPGGYCKTCHWGRDHS